MEAAQSPTYTAAETKLTWKDVLAGEREQEYFKKLISFVEQERTAGKTIYPPNADIFNALHYTTFENLKVVILGQDPYHGPNQAHGLCFSVRRGVKSPPSLENIFKEIQTDLGISRPKHGCLESWAMQGVLLLNTVLTVEAGKPQSHAGLGWERFTDRIISEVSLRKQSVVFLLWGSPAQKKASLIDSSKHLMLKSTHPSPLSAHRGFLGCKHFSRTNAHLRSIGLPEIDWALTSS